MHLKFEMCKTHQSFVRRPFYLSSGLNQNLSQSPLYPTPIFFMTTMKPKSGPNGSSYTCWGGRRRGRGWERGGTCWAFDFRNKVKLVPLYWWFRPLCCWRWQMTPTYLPQMGLYVHCICLYFTSFVLTVCSVQIINCDVSWWSRLIYLQSCYDLFSYKKWWWVGQLRFDHGSSFPKGTSCWLWALK